MWNWPWFQCSYKREYKHQIFWKYWQISLHFYRLRTFTIFDGYWSDIWPDSVENTLKVWIGQTSYFLFTFIISLVSISYLWSIRPVENEIWTYFFSYRLHIGDFKATFTGCPNILHQDKIVAISQLPYFKFLVIFFSLFLPCNLVTNMDMMWYYQRPYNCILSLDATSTTTQR